MEAKFYYFRLVGETGLDETSTGETVISQTAQSVLRQKDIIVIFIGTHLLCCRFIIVNVLLMRPHGLAFTWLGCYGLYQRHMSKT